MKIKREALADAPKFRRFAGPTGTPQGELKVERRGGMHSQGLIRGASLVTRGEALGHGYWLDEQFVADVADGVNQYNQGVKSRYTHPSLSADGLGKHLGRATGSTVAGDKALADIHFTKSSHNTPEGDLSGYVMDLAEESPEDFAISIVFEPDWNAEVEFMLEHGAVIDKWGYLDTTDFKSPDPDNVDNLPHARLSKMLAADFVADPAANPDGLFSSEQKFAEEADAVASFALGLSDKKPTATALGLDADRVQQFVTRFLTQHNLEVIPMKKKLGAAAPPAEPETKQDATPAASTETSAEASTETATSESEPAADPAPEPAADPAPALSADRAEAKRFREAFGDKGPVWYAEGFSFEECQAKQFAELRGQVEELAKENGELKAKLAKGPQGEQTPVGFDSGEQKKQYGGIQSKFRIVGGAPAAA